MGLVSRNELLKIAAAGRQHAGRLLAVHLATLGLTHGVELVHRAVHIREQIGPAVVYAMSKLEISNTWNDRKISLQ